MPEKSLNLIPAAQRELFLRTRAAVHRTLFRILGSNHEVEDLLQETYLMVFRSIHRFEGRSSPSTWCCGIAVHVVTATAGKRANLAAVFARKQRPLGVDVIVEAHPELEDFFLVKRR